MKPNDKAIEAAARSLFGDYGDDEKKWVEDALTAAYAAQFQSEDYADLIRSLRGEPPTNSTLDPLRAADAIEALLAERDALKSEGLELVAENTCLQRRLESFEVIKQVSNVEKLLTTLRNNYMRRTREMLTVKKERDALLARLAPVDDYNLEILAAKEFIEATTDMPPRTTYTISKRSLSGARNAIAAIRPHIEAAEREMIADKIKNWGDEPHFQLLAAAIRRDK